MNTIDPQTQRELVLETKVGMALYTLQIHLDTLVAYKRELENNAATPGLLARVAKANRRLDALIAEFTRL